VLNLVIFGLQIQKIGRSFASPNGWLSSRAFPCILT